MQPTNMENLFKQFSVLTMFIDIVGIRNEAWLKCFNLLCVVYCTFDKYVDVIEEFLGEIER